MRQVNSVVLAGAQYLGIASQFVTGPLLARALGPDDRGILATALVIVGVAPLILGMGAPAAYRAAATRGWSHFEARKSLVRSTWTTVILSVPTAMIIAHWLAPDARTFWSVTWMITAAGTTVWRSAVLSSSVITSDTWLIARNQVVNGIVTLAGIGSLFALGQLDIVSASITYGFASIFTTLMLIRKGNWISTSRRKVSKKYGITSVFGQLGEVGLIRVDQVLVIAFLGNSLAGQYSVAYSYAFMMLPLLYALTTKTMAGRTLGFASIKNNLRTVLTQASVSFIMAVVMAILADPIIVILFGHEYEPAIEIARLLCVSSAMMGIVYMLMQLNHSEARGGVNSLCSLLGFSAIVTFALLFKESYGVLGIAVSTIIGVTICAALLVFTGRKSTLNPNSKAEGY